METILLVVHVVIAVAIVGLILLQQGKGAEMGASFGSGSSQTVFGAAGSGNFFTKMTSLLSALFFATSFTLAIFARDAVNIQEPLIPILENIGVDAALNAQEGAAANGEQAVPPVQNEVPVPNNQQDRPPTN